MKEINNNISEDYVSFEIAKLLKEKGFDIDGVHNWAERTDLGMLYFGGNKVFHELPRVKDHQFAIIYPRPTHALAIKWIRKNIEFIDIWIEPYLSKNPKLYTPCIWHRGGYIRLNPEKSFELANEVALLYTLKNLI